MNDVPLKRCSQGEKCLHPDGPLLPKTEEFFGLWRHRNGRDYFRSVCRECDNQRRAKHKYGDKYDEWRAKQDEYEASQGQGLRRCSSGDNCAHPDGPWLPSTRDYFNSNPTNLSGLRANCRACDTVRRRQKWHGENYEQAEAERSLRQDMCEQGFKRCCRGEQCVHPFGPWLPATTEYFPNGGSRGLSPRCRACNAEKIRQSVRKDPEEARRRNAEASRKRRARMTEEQRQQEREVNRERNRRRNAEDPFHPIKAVIATQRRRAKVAALPHTFTLSDWTGCLTYFENRCAVCGRSPDAERTLAADHWIPLASPDCPGTVATNMLPLCHGLGGCNNSKRASDPVAWLTRKYGTGRAREILARIEAYFTWVRQQESGD